MGAHTDFSLCFGTSGLGAYLGRKCMPYASFGKPLPAKLRLGLKNHGKIKKKAKDFNC